MASSATYHDADLLLRVYDLRRETRLRQARDFCGKAAVPNTYTEFRKKYPMDSKGARHMGMVFTYWETACALVDRGLINEELFQATTGEHVWLWYKFRAGIVGQREEFGYPEMLANWERVATRHPLASKMEQWVAAPAAPKSAAKSKKKTAAA